MDHRNPAKSAKPPTVTRRPVPGTPPGDVAKAIAEGRKTHPEMALYLWLAAITGARRGELCAMQVRDLDLDISDLHLAFNYVVVDGRRVRQDTKSHQDRYLAIDPLTCTMLREYLATGGGMPVTFLERLLLRVRLSVRLREAWNR
jgi:integrase